MKNLLVSLAVAAAGLAALGFGAPAAHAQAGSVLVVDYDRLIQDSKAGKDMTGKLDAIQKQMQAEVEPERNAIEAETKQIEAQAPTLTQEVIAQNPELRARLQNLQRRQATLQQRAQVLARDFQYTQNVALEAFLKEVNTELGAVLQSRSPSLVLRSTDVLWAHPANEITSELLSRLDARVSAIAVSRQIAPQQQAQNGAGAVPRR